MKRDARIFVAGHRGLAGSAIVRRLQTLGYENILTRTHQELDLEVAGDVEAFFEEQRPEYVFLAAAKVGGILANATYPADFLFRNLKIQTNVIECAKRFAVARLLFLGSSCIYPRMAKQPIAEDELLSGPLEFTNRSYAIAKISGIEACWALNRQYGTSFLAAMPTNLYGLRDNYDPKGSHVLPALIRKVHEAKQRNDQEVVVWGTGKPMREFLYADDMADACIFLMNLGHEVFEGIVREPQTAPLVNVGFGSDVSIAELAAKVCEVIGYSGRLKFDSSMPDGTPKKLMDSSRLFSLGWRPQVELQEGIARAYADFLSRAAAQPTE